MGAGRRCLKRDRQRQDDGRAVRESRPFYFAPLGQSCGAQPPQARQEANKPGKAPGLFLRLSPGLGVDSLAVEASTARRLAGLATLPAPRPTWAS
jgi:hypothetical protein